MAIDLKNLTPAQKFFGVALVGVTIFALYVKSKNVTPTRSATSGTSPGTVSGTQDLTGITSAFTTGLKGIQDANAKIEAGLAKVIADSNAATVASINAQSTAFGSALNTVGTGNQKAIKDLETAQTGGFTALSTYLNSQFGDIKSGQQDVKSGIAGGFTSLGTVLAQNLAAIQNLVSISDADRDLQYTQVGLQSSASCFNGSGYATTCVRSHLPDYVNGVWQGGDLSDSEIKQYVRQNLAGKYPSCLQGGHFDLKCVGKEIVTKGYGV